MKSNPPIARKLADEIRKQNNTWTGSSEWPALFMATNNALAAFDAETEKSTCPYCVNGIVRSLGRDNDEIISDCEHCNLTLAEVEAWIVQQFNQHTPSTRQRYSRALRIIDKAKASLKK